MSTSLLYHGFGVRDYRYMSGAVRGGGCGVRDRTEAGDVSLRRLWFSERVASWGGRAAVSDRAARHQAGGVGGQDPSAGLPGLRPGSPGGRRFRRAETDLQQVV